MSWIERMLVAPIEYLLNARCGHDGRGGEQALGFRIGVAPSTVDRQRLEPYVIAQRDFSRHLVTVGSSGGGKTSMLFVVLVALLLAGYGGVIIDVHDAVPKFLNLIVRQISNGVLPESVLDRMLVISFGDGKPVRSFNPLARVQWLSPHRVGQQMAAILRRQWPDATWGAPSTELIANTFCLMA